MNQTSDTMAKPVTCHTCGHENIPGAAFCSRCGVSLRGDTPEESGGPAPTDDVETTTAYRPIVDASQPAQSSPWARPGTDSETIIDLEPSAEQTSAIPIAEPVPHTESQPATSPPSPTPVPRDHVDDDSIRGFFLGVAGLILIGVVLAVYVYAAWLSDSTRNTIDGWLPWVS